MSHWNYRVMKSVSDRGDVSFGIHEVYYDTNGKPEMHTENAVRLDGEFIDDIQKDLEYIQVAFTKPTLIWINGKYEEVSK